MRPERRHNTCMENILGCDPLRGIVVYLYTVGMSILQAILIGYALYLFVTWVIDQR